MGEKTRLDRLAALFQLENEWGGDDEITILPNGEIQARSEPLPDTGTLKPLTFREMLGGEYATI